MSFGEPVQGEEGHTSSHASSLFPATDAELKVAGTKRQTYRRSRRSRRRPDNGHCALAAGVPAASLKPAERITLSRNAALSLAHLEEKMNEAVDLVDSLLAVDFSVYYTTGVRQLPLTNPLFVAKPDDSPACLATTPPRPGTAVQAGRDAAKKVENALAATDMAVLSTRMTNLKAKTPPQQRYLSQKRTPEPGSLTARERRVSGSPATTAAPHPAPVQSRFYTGSSGPATNNGSITARGPRALPFSTTQAAAFDQSPSRAVQPPLTARPSRLGVVPALALPQQTVGTGTSNSGAAGATTTGNQPPSVPLSGPAMRLTRALSHGRTGALGATLADEPLVSPRGTRGGAPFSPRVQQPANPVTARPPWRYGNSAGQLAAPLPGSTGSAAAATGIMPPCDPTFSAAVPPGKAVAATPRLFSEVAKQQGQETARTRRRHEANRTSADSNGSSSSGGGSSGREDGVRRAAAGPSSSAVAAVAAVASKPTAPAASAVPRLKLGGLGR